MPKTEGEKCLRCGSFQHRADKCSHTKTACNYCKKAGHRAKVCFKEKRESEKCTKAHHVTATSTGETVPSETEDNQFTVNMKSVASSANPANTPPLYKLFVTIEDKKVPMEVDTGSSVTLLNSSDFFRIGNQIDPLKPPTAILEGYTENTIKCLEEKRDEC